MKTAPVWQKPAAAWQLDGRVLRVQCPPVLDLVPLLSAPSFYLALSTLTRPDDREWLFGQMMRYGSPITDALLDAVADALVFTWCSVPRWFAARLWEEMLPRWVQFEGPLTGRGVDVAELDAARATRLVWSTLQGWHANEKDKGEGWRRRIEQTPIAAVVAEAARPAVAADSDGDSFMKVFGAVGHRAR